MSNKNESLSSETPLDFESTPEQVARDAEQMQRPEIFVSVFAEAVPLSTGGVGTRREARERALALHYEAETRGISPQLLLAEQPVSVMEFTEKLLLAWEEHKDAVDALLVANLKEWSLSRLPAIDRTLLRLAISELLAFSDVPTGVILAEAVELAKAYSTEESSRFVNGVLGSVAQQVRGI